MKTYLLDSNFFIQAHRAIYPLDVASSFWVKIKSLAHQGKLISIDKVKNELYRNEDELKQWCEDNLPEDFFKETSTFIQQYAEVSAWANSKSTHYLQKAITEFLDYDLADAWLISYAMSNKSNFVIVTHEISEPNRKNKIKIPDVCVAKSVICCNTIEMLRQLGETF